MSKREDKVRNAEAHKKEIGLAYIVSENAPCSGPGAKQGKSSATQKQRA